MVHFPEIRPKGVHLKSDLLKVAQYLGYFCSKTRPENLSKVAQSGHTAVSKVAHSGHTAVSNYMDFIFVTQRALKMFLYCMAIHKTLDLVRNLNFCNL